MKKINLFTFVVLTLAMTFVSSCNKDDDTTDPVTGDCLMTKMDATFFGETSTSVITYNSANQVIDMQTNDAGDISGTQYSYTSAGKVSVMEEYEGASKVVTGKTEYTYDANGVIVEKVYVDNGGSSLELDEVYRYDYTSGKVSRKNIFSVVGGQEVKYAYADYTYAANGDLSSTLTYVEDGMGAWEESSRRTFTYSDKTADRFLNGLIAEDPNFPSTHYITLDKQEDYNSVTQSWEVSSELDYAYTFDTKGNPTKIDIGQGLVVFNITWTC